MEGPIKPSIFLRCKDILNVSWILSLLGKLVKSWKIWTIDVLRLCLALCLLSTGNFPRLRIPSPENLLLQLMAQVAGMCHWLKALLSQGKLWEAFISSQSQAFISFNAVIFYAFNLSSTLYLILKRLKNSEAWLLLMQSR